MRCGVLVASFIAFPCVWYAIIVFISLVDVSQQSMVPAGFAAGFFFGEANRFHSFDPSSHHFETDSMQRDKPAFSCKNTPGSGVKIRLLKKRICL
jgi:hypothetical protein